MSKVYRCTLEVRGYELDSFGHVNHAVYVSYLEHARWKMLGEEGITPAQFDEWKRWPVIGGLELKYLKPTFIGDELDIQSEVLQHGRSHFLIGRSVPVAVSVKAGSSSRKVGAAGVVLPA